MYNTKGDVALMRNKLFPRSCAVSKIKVLCLSSTSGTVHPRLSVPRLSEPRLSEHQTWCWIVQAEHNSIPFSEDINL